MVNPIIRRAFAHYNCWSFAPTYFVVLSQVRQFVSFTFFQFYRILNLLTILVNWEYSGDTRRHQESIRHQAHLPRPGKTAGGERFGGQRTTQPELSCLHFSVPCSTRQLETNYSFQSNDHECHYLRLWIRFSPTGNLYRVSGVVGCTVRCTMTFSLQNAKHSTSHYYRPFNVL